MEMERVDIEHSRRIVERMTEEAIRAIFEQIQEKDIVIDGRPAKISIFYPPKLDPCERAETDNLYGKWAFGVDVTDADKNWHLEFIMYQGGWGGMPVPKLRTVTAQPLNKE